MLADAAVLRHLFSTSAEVTITPGSCRKAQVPVPWCCCQPGIAAQICNCQQRHCASCGRTGARSWMLTLPWAAAASKRWRRTQDFSPLPQPHGPDRPGQCVLTHYTHTRHCSEEPLQKARTVQKKKKKKKAGSTLTLLNRFKKLHIGFDFKVDRKS